MRIGATCACKVGQELMLFANSFNIIFFVNLNNGNIRFRNGIPEEDFMSPFLVSEIIDTGECFVFVPMHAKKIWKCNKNFEKWSSIDIEYPDNIGKFYSAILVENDIYILQHNYPYSIKINIKNYEINKLEIGEDIFIINSVKYKNKIFCAVACKDYIISCDLDNKDKIEKILIGEKNGINGICLKDSTIILAPRAGENMYMINDDIVKNVKIPYIETRGVFTVNDEIIITSSSKYESIKVKDEKFIGMNCLEENKENFKIFEENRKAENYIFTQNTCDGEIIVIDSHSNIKIYDKKGNKLLDKELVLDKKTLKCLMNDESVYSSKIMKNENFNFILKDFLEIIK